MWNFRTFYPSHKILGKFKNSCLVYFTATNLQKFFLSDSSCIVLFVNSSSFYKILAIFGAREQPVFEFRSEAVVELFSLRGPHLSSPPFPSIVPSSSAVGQQGRRHPSAGVHWPLWPVRRGASPPARLSSLPLSLIPVEDFILLFPR